MADGTGRRPTIRDVASAAGVSKSLVSLLYAGGSVGEERRERILAAADRLGFRPNLTARTLSSSDGGFTGILVADLHNPALAEVVDAARHELARHGSSALLTAATMPGPGGLELDERALAVLRDLRPRSILVVGSIPDLHALAETITGTPLVIASAIATGVRAAATVRTDDEAGIRLAVDHLVERGHRRIAHIGGAGGMVAERRRAAYEAAMIERGLGGEARVAEADFSERAGFAAAGALLAQPQGAPEALVAVNDLAAIGALAAFDDVGARPATVGYDDTSVARLRQVSLTSVDPGNAEIGARAARAILDLEGGSQPASTEVLVAPRLAVRASTGFANA